MDKKELKKKELKELKKVTEKKRSEVSQAYLDMRMGKVKNVRSPRRLRKDLAVMYTITREKELNKLSVKSKDAKDQADGKSSKK